MKVFAGTLLTLVLGLFGTTCNARGTPTSSFVPHNSHQPHATLSHKHSANQGGHYVGGHGSSHKGGHYVNPKTADHYTHNPAH